MKFFSATILIALPCIAIAKEEPVLEFINGDRLQGNLSRVDDQSIFWKSSLLKKETPFYLEQARDITFPLRPAPERKGDHIAHIRFNPDLRQQNEKISGDVIEGELIAVNQDNIILNTWYAGQLKLNRNMVKDLEITDVAPSIYAGPLDAKEWKSQPADSWTYDKNSYTGDGSGSLAKDFDKLPDRYCFRFTASWTNRFGLQILFGADSIEEETPDDYYMIVLDNGTSYLQKRASNRNAVGGGIMRNGGMIGEYKRDQAFRNKEKSEMRLYVDTTTGIIALYSDETLIQQWQDIDQPMLSGPCIILRQSSGRSYAMNISRISVSTWDGSLPGTETTITSNPIDNPDPQEGEQRIILRNGDVLLGKVEKIENSEITLKTRFNEIKLPVSRIRKLALDPAEYDERLLQNGDVRAWFADGNYTTFRLDGIDADGKITGSSQHFGTAVFDPAAFTRIEFNIYPSPVKQ